MIKRILLLSCCWCFSLFVFAQAADDAFAEDSTEEVADTAIEKQADAFVIPVVRKLSDDTLTALKAQKDFAYMQYIDSFFRHKRVAENIPVQTNTKPGTSVFSNRGLRTLYWLLAMSAVGWILLKMFAGKGSLFAFNKKLAVKNIALPRNQKEPEPDLVADAINEKNYRLAVRYLYLQTLQTLGANQQLYIAPQKTNYQYIQEIRPKDLQQMFALLTMHYEYAWFGDFNLSATQFNIIQQEFEQFNNRIG